MTAGAGEAGKQMKARGHKIALNVPTSLVARAVRTGEIVTVDNVREALDWLPNPLLPDTYSEMAVPIILEGQVVGVLDVQERRIAGLDESDANLLRSLANQVAVAIRNARLFAEVEKALAEAHATQERYLERDWDKARITRRNRGHVQFSQTETTLNEEIIAAARQHALADEGLTLVALKGVPENTEDQAKGGAGQTDYALVTPIKLRNVTIGNLQLHGVEPDRQWTEDEQALLSAVIDQVAQVAENIRLLDETQERASRERLIGQVSDRLRRAPNLETLMQIGVEELSRVLQPARTFLRFGLETELLSTLGNSSKARDQEVHSTSVALVPTDSQEAANGQGDKSHE
jgi:GAF domain-containing protein